MSGWRMRRHSSSAEAGAAGRASAARTSAGRRRVGAEPAEGRWGIGFLLDDVSRGRSGWSILGAPAGPVKRARRERDTRAGPHGLPPAGTFAGPRHACLRPPNLPAGEAVTG